jgi:Glycosyltransferase family 87
MIKHLRQGGWLNNERVRRISIISLLITIAMMVLLFASAHGTVDRMGRPLGTDFSNVWTAGKMALNGQAAQAWDWQSHLEVQRKTHHDPNIPFYGWHYPPPFLLIAASLALFPYLMALILWQVSTLALAIKTVRAIVPDSKAILIALGCPVVLVCFGHGHNGFLTGALLCGGLLLLDKRPWIAGILLGCMIYKPQFGLVLPVVMLIGGHWRAIMSATIAALLLSLITIVLWGLPVWSAFIDSLPLTQSVVIEQGSTGWEKIQSVYSAVRNWGGSIALGWGVQSAATLIAIAGTALIARGQSLFCRNAVVIAAALLATPYCLDYDLVPLEMGLAFLIVDGRERGFLDWEKSLYALVWAIPSFGRAGMAATTIPFGLIAIMIVFGLGLRRSGHFGDMSALKSWPFRHSHELSAP